MHGKAFRRCLRLDDLQMARPVVLTHPLGQFRATNLVGALRSLCRTQLLFGLSDQQIDQLFALVWIG